MSHWHNESTDLLCDALLSLKTREEAYAFLEDVATVKETLDLAQRLSVARMLDEGVSYLSIRDATGASTATISRVNKCYEYGSGGYRTVLERLKKGVETYKGEKECEKK